MEIKILHEWSDHFAAGVVAVDRVLVHINKLVARRWAGDQVAQLPVLDGQSLVVDSWPGFEELAVLTNDLSLGHVYGDAHYVRGEGKKERREGTEEMNAKF